MRQRIFKDAEKWRQVFKKCFGDRKIIFYLSFGEPTIDQGFNDVLDIIASEPNWSLHITTNLSLPLNWWKKLMNHRLVKEGRLYINASFHPTQTSINSFLSKILLLREHEIECPVIIVMWPPLIDNFKKYFDVFNKYHFLVHVRRFHGWYKGKYYPRAYTEDERRFIAKYADDATIKYMMNDHFGKMKGKLSYAGMYYFLIDENGDVWESPDSKGRCLGNIFAGNVRLYTEPHPYSGRDCASVNGVSAFVELGYEELEPNFVISFAKQGGVFHTGQGVYYKHMRTNFDDSKLRKEYNFPNLLDKILIAICTNLLGPLYRMLYSWKDFQPIRLALRLIGLLHSAPPTRLRPLNFSPSRRLRYHKTDIKNVARAQ